MDISKITANFVNKTIRTLPHAIKKAQNPIEAEKVTSRLDGLKGLASQNSLLVQKKYEKFDLSSMLSELKEEAIEVKPFKIYQKGNETALEAYHGTQRGTNKGFFVFNPDDSKLYYAKMGKDDQSAYEVFASKLYELAGVNVSKMQTFSDESGNIGLLSEYIANLIPITTPNKMAANGFGVDAWLANWDALCSNNLQTNGVKEYRIDFGGALKYRAQGARKSFDDVPSEITSLINPKINPESSYILSCITKTDLVDSLKKVINLKDEDIIKLAKEFCPKDAEHISKTLIKRKEFFEYMLELIEKTPCEKKSILEYLTEIQEKVLNTPLWEFDSYKGSLQKPKTTILSKIKQIIPQKKQDNDKIIQEMEQQRSQINFCNKYYSLSSFLSHEIKNSCGLNVNTYIRWGEKNNNISKMDDIISQTSLPKMTLYRGSSKSDFCLPRANSQEFLDKTFQKGKCFRIPIYPNTSLNKKIAQDYAMNNGDILWRFNVPKGTKGVWMENLSEIEEKINKRNEQEVLLQRNLPCKFKNRTPYFTHDLVEADVLKYPEKHKFVDLKKEYEGLKY